MSDDQGDQDEIGRRIKPYIETGIGLIIALLVLAGLLGLFRWAIYR